MLNLFDRREPAAGTGSPAEPRQATPPGTTGSADRARRACFLRVANRCWLAVGGIALGVIPAFPSELPFFAIFIAATCATYAVIEFLQRKGKTVAGGLLFCGLLNATVYGLMLLNYAHYGFRDREAIMTRVSGLAMMGSSIIFAGATVGGGAALGFALLNTVLLAIAVVFVDARLGPKVSIPIFWWFLAVAVWLYERYVTRALVGLEEAQNTLERRVEERTGDLQTTLARLDRSVGETAAANAELESFSYSVAHDLRAPLRRIVGFADILKEDYGGSLDEGGRDVMKAIRDQSLRMSQLIEDLLRLAHAGRAPLRRTELDLSAMAGQIAGELQAKDPLRKVDWSIEPDLRTTGDPGLARIVLENLLGNAWKFTSKAPDAKIIVGSRPLPRGRLYFVQDNGAGFDPAAAGKLFQPFERLHSESEFSGSGVGLATVQRIVKRHGGTIRAVGEPGKGATFTFTLESGASPESGETGTPPAGP
jgi:signal transduction histidine kinase